MDEKDQAIPQILIAQCCENCRYFARPSLNVALGVCNAREYELEGEEPQRAVTARYEVCELFELTRSIGKRLSSIRRWREELARKLGEP